MLEGSSYSGHIEWNKVIKKEAKGINNEDLGEVQEVTQDYVLVEKGVINKEKLYIPRDLAVGYNGATLIFNITAEEAKNKFLRKSPPVFSQSQSMGEDASITDDLIIVPVMAERLDVTKKVSSQEARIIKESITEIKAVEVPLTHDEIYIETRPIIGESERQVNNEGGGPYIAEPSIKLGIPTQEDVVTLILRVEVPEVIKHHYVKEEIVVKKKSFTEIKKINEHLRSERVTVEGATEEEVNKREDNEADTTT
jgi:uncharacterized protein (TIGR02271 family)